MVGDNTLPPKFVPDVWLSVLRERESKQFMDGDDGKCDWPDVTEGDS